MSVRLLLCTDLDRTLLPNGPQPESSGARNKFEQFVTTPDITLVYVTGRDRQLVIDAIEKYQLPDPDYVIADVGSTIYAINKDKTKPKGRQQANWRHNDKWHQEISTDWQARSNQDLQQLFSEISSLRLQQAAKQNSYKLSYYVALDTNHETLIDEMQSILVQHNIKASLIWSIDELAATGLLDVLPASANKQHAIKFLMEQTGFDLSNTIFAGDSGNDLAVLSSPVNSVLVANASSEVCQQAKQLVSNSGQIETLYFAEGGFLGMNGNYSAGILEGIAHYRKAKYA